MRFLKKYWLEIVSFCDLELFVWAITRRYFEKPASRVAETVLDALIMVSGIALVIFVWRLSKKWRQQAAERVRALSRRLLRQLSERVMRILERWQRMRGRGADDLLGGRTRVEYDLFDSRGRRKKQKRAHWKQLESERERIRWLYAGMIEGRLKRGAHIRSAETPWQIARHEDSTPEQQELIDLYTDCRYDPRRQPTEGKAQRWKDNYTR